MKRLATLIVTLFILVTLGASAACIVKPDTINTVFQSYNDTDWTTSWYNGDGGALTIESTANVGGHTYTVGIEGSRESVERVYMIGWFADMYMLDGGQFSEGLDAYNALHRTCEEFLPDDEAIDYVFSAYDIGNALREGSRYFEGETFDGWTLVNTQPGQLILRGRTATLEAQRLDDGRFWFAVNF